MTAQARLRDRDALAAEMTALRDRVGGERCAFRQGARDALRWLVRGGPGPLTGVVTGLPIPARAIVGELGVAEDLIHGRPSGPRDYAMGLEHALMWAEYATAASPSATRQAGVADRSVPTLPLRARSHSAST
jgi:hypothetical protein